jgi:hypothetical protein
VRGNFELWFKNEKPLDPKKFWCSLSVEGVTVIAFDATTKMAHVVEPRLPAEETSNASAN